MKTGILLTVVAMSLAACSAKVSSDGGAGAPAPSAPAPFQDKVKGPSLEGNWVSDCRSGYASDYYQLKYAIVSQKIHWEKNEFSDSACKIQTHHSEMDGEFRFSQKFANGSYELEYHFAIENGYSITGENVRLTEGVLFVSEFYLGEQSLPTTALKLQSSTVTPPAQPPVTQPEPNPNDTVGIKATTWSEVKYVFCATQGFAWLMDFKGADMSKISGGTLKAAARVCNTKDDFKWKDGYDFTLTGNDKNFKLSIADGASYIQDNGSGLTAAWAVLGGNSGLCYFIKNKATRGLDYDCE